MKPPFSYGFPMIFFLFEAGESPPAQWSRLWDPAHVLVVVARRIPEAQAAAWDPRPGHGLPLAMGSGRWSAECHHGSSACGGPCAVECLVGGFSAPAQSGCLRVIDCCPWRWFHPSALYKAFWCSYSNHVHTMAASIPRGSWRSIRRQNARSDIEGNENLLCVALLLS